MDGKFESEMSKGGELTVDDGISGVKGLDMGNFSSFEVCGWRDRTS